MIGGLHIQYFLVCKRKLWLYSKNIGFEEEHDQVIAGQLLHNRAYNYTVRKEWMIDQQFKIDVLDGEYVREVKLSRKMSEADRYQLLFYLYQLKNRGLERKGLISYTKEKRTEEVILTKEDEEKLDWMEQEIKKIIQRKTVPPLVRKPYCRSCAYFDFCFAGEIEEEE